MGSFGGTLPTPPETDGDGKASDAIPQPLEENGVADGTTNDNSSHFDHSDNDTPFFTPISTPVLAPTSSSCDHDSMPVLNLNNTGVGPLDVAGQLQSQPVQFTAGDLEPGNEPAKTENDIEGDFVFIKTDLEVELENEKREYNLTLTALTPTPLSEPLIPAFFSISTHKLNASSRDGSCIDDHDHKNHKNGD